jgi:hypothetical protein
LLTLDPITAAQFATASLASERAAIVLAALSTDDVTITVRDPSGAIMGSGTLPQPWAVQASAVLTVGEVESFDVMTAGTPSAVNWTLRLECGDRWLRGSFGLTGGDFNWSLGSWAVGQAGTFGTVTFTAIGAPDEPVDDEDWLTRSTGAGVVWSHDFRSDDEVDDWINMTQNAPYNKALTFGTHDRIMHAHRTVADPSQFTTPIRAGEITPPLSGGKGGYGCLQLVNIGATLAADITSEPYVDRQVLASGTFAADTGTTNIYDGSLECAQLTASYITSANAGVNGEITLRLSGTTGGAWDGYYVVSSVTNLGATYRYGLRRAKLTGAFASGSSGSFTVDSILLGATTNPTETITIDASNAGYWPNPAGDATKTYTAMIQSGAEVARDGTYPAGYIHFPIVTSADGLTAAVTPQVIGAKGMKECVVVLSRSGTTLTVRRGGAFDERADFGNYGFPIQFLAGTPIGNDCDGGWARQLGAYRTGDNGKTVDDYADPDSNGVPQVAYRTRGASVNSRRCGYYAHQFFHSHVKYSPSFMGNTAVFDGTEFYLQFRFFISANRLTAGSPEQKLWFLDTMDGAAGHQCVANGVDGFGPPDYIGTFGQKGQQLYDHEEGNTTYKQPDTTISPPSEYPLLVEGDSEAVGRRWPLGEWVTVLVHVKPGFPKDYQIPHPNSQRDSAAELTVMTDEFTPTNNGTTLEFETTVPRDFQFSPVSRSEENYFANMQVKFPATLLGGAAPAAVLRAYTMKVQASEVIDYSGTLRMHWTVVQKGTATAFPPASLIPVQGEWMQASIYDLPNTWNGLSQPLKIDAYELTIRRDSTGEIYHPFRKYDYSLVYGANGNSELDSNPPGYNRFQPTGYANVQDNQQPAPVTHWTRYDQIIFSRQPIPWPND